MNGMNVRVESKEMMALTRPCRSVWLSYTVGRRLGVLDYSISFGPLILSGRIGCPSGRVFGQLLPIPFYHSLHWLDFTLCI